MLGSPGSSAKWLIHISCACSSIPFPCLWCFGFTSKPACSMRCSCTAISASLAVDDPSRSRVQGDEVASAAGSSARRGIVGRSNVDTPRTTHFANVLPLLARDPSTGLSGCQDAGWSARAEATPLPKRRGPAGGAGERPAARCKQRADDEERDVPGRLVAARANVVDPEDMMVDDAFDEVEHAPADEHPAEERAPVDGPPPLAGAVPEDVETRRHRHPRRGVEEAVRERVRLEAGDGRRGILALAREHVMPLEDLVENDPVNEPAKPDSEQNPGRTGTR